MNSADKDLPTVGRQEGAVESDPSFSKPQPPLNTTAEKPEDDWRHNMVDIVAEGEALAAAEAESRANAPAQAQGEEDAGMFRPYIPDDVTEPEEKAKYRTPVNYQLACHAITACSAPFIDKEHPLTAEDMLAEFQMAEVQDQDCETMLFMQAQILDSAFGHLLVDGMAEREKKGGEPDGVFERRLNLALRTQNQCRTTVRALAAIREAKKPKQSEKWTEEDFENYASRLKEIRKRINFNE